LTHLKKIGNLSLDFKSFQGSEVSGSTRLNIALPMETMIAIGKECEKRGMKPPQFAKEAIHEKLKVINNDPIMEKMKDIELFTRSLRDDVRDIKEMMLKMQIEK
jgi:hypothetical protein